MTDLGWVVAVGVASLALAGVARRWAARRGTAVDSSRIVDGPAIVVFTAEHCVRCATALALARTHSLPVVEIRAETDGPVMAAHGIEGVPVTVVAGASGRPVAQFGGVPPARRLRRAVDRARNTASG